MISILYFSIIPYLLPAGKLQGQVKNTITPQRTGYSSCVFILPELSLLLPEHKLLHIQPLWPLFLVMLSFFFHNYSQFTAEKECCFRARSIRTTEKIIICSIS